MSIIDQVLTGFLRSVSKASSERPKTVLTISLLAGVAAFFAMTSMHVDATFLGIVDEEDPDARVFRDVSTAFGGTGNILLLVRGPDLEDNKAFVRELAPELESLKSVVKGVDYQFSVGQYLQDLPDNVALLDLAQARQLSQLLAKNDTRACDFARRPSSAGFFRLLESGLDVAIQQAMTGNTSQNKLTESSKLQSQQLQALLQIIESQLDPSNPEPSLSSLLNGSSPAHEAQQFLRDGWIATEFDSTTVTPHVRLKNLQKEWAVLVTVRLKISVLDTALGVDSFKSILTATEKVAKRHEKVDFGYAGAPAYGYEDQQSVLQRTRWISSLSLILVLALFFFVDRSWLGPFVVGLPLLLGTLWTFALVKLFIGYISITSAIFGILLFGLGVDFAIHIVVRYNDSRAMGMDHKAALDAALILTGRGVLTGGLTSAAAFFGMLVNRTKAAHHLGLTTGFGLLCCLFAMLLVLPALLTLSQNWRKDHQKTAMSVPWLESWVQFVTRHPKKTLLFAVIFSVGGLFLGTRASIEYDIEKIATKGTRASEIRHNIDSIFKIATDFALCLVPDRQTAESSTAKIRAAKLKTLARIESITDYLPHNGVTLDKELTILAKRFKDISAKPIAKSPKQEKSIDALRALLQKTQGLLQFSAQLPESQSGLSAEQRETLVNSIGSIVRRLATPEGQQRLTALDLVIDQWLTRSTSALRQSNPRGLRIEDLPDALRRKFQDADGRLVLYAFPRKSMLRGSEIMNFFAELEQFCPITTGVGKIINLFVKKSIKDLPFVTSFVSLIVLLVVGADFRSARLALLVFVPLAFALGMAIGAIVVFGQVVSVLMLAGFPLILGIGVDDGVHLVHRVLEDPSKSVVSAVSETGKAILLTSVTTMVSFGGLLFMNHHGLEGLGFLVTFGVGLCFVASVTIFPALLVLTKAYFPSLAAADQTKDSSQNSESQAESASEPTQEN